MSAEYERPAPPQSTYLLTQTVLHTSPLYLPPPRSAQRIPKFTCPPTHRSHRSYSNTTAQPGPWKYQESSRGRAAVVTRIEAGAPHAHPHRRPPAVTQQCTVQLQTPPIAPSSSCDAPDSGLAPPRGSQNGEIPMRAASRDDVDVPARAQVVFEYEHAAGAAG
ncbi:hypothetical protein JB92DRAFT_1293264 [Gautieria morchelliformis]|nr:hypothetical protein JB92DRAFT_1293264 [Gautieria morchelliformis]